MVIYLSSFTHHDKYLEYLVLNAISNRDFADKDEPHPSYNKFRDRQFPRFLIYGVSRFKNHRPVNSINKQSGIIVVDAVFESRWPTDVSPLN